MGQRNLKLPTGNNEKRAEGRADHLKGVAKDKKGHLKDLFKFP